MNVRIREPGSESLAGVHDLLPLAAAHPDRYPCLLESAAPGPCARFDLLFGFPDASLALHGDGRVRDGDGVDRGASFLAALDAARAQTAAPHQRVAEHEALPFAGGWVLYLGYELAAEVEPSLRLPMATDAVVPVALALHCPAAIVVDRAAGSTSLVGTPAQRMVLRDDLRCCTTLPDPVAQPERIIEDDPKRFLDGVARVHDYLRRGDTFQVNLSRGWHAEYLTPPAPAALHAALRAANPAPFAGLLQQPGWAVVSSSPERLLERRGARVQTRPIAGTRPRVAGDDESARIAELLGHAKERAEHVMLVDLERNDLGRVCVPGSVRVDEMMAVESYAHVHHIVSNVEGRLREGVTAGQAIAAVFPGGTITGCPKVRCMQIIAELEGVPRGAYTGALGYLGDDGDMDLNILIRTLEVRGRQVGFRAGAGIVVDSDAAHELDETRAKARGLLRALGVAG